MLELGWNPDSLIPEPVILTIYRTDFSLYPNKPLWARARPCFFLFLNTLLSRVPCTQQVLGKWLLSSSSLGVNNLSPQKLCDLRQILPFSGPQFPIYKAWSPLRNCQGISLEPCFQGSSQL